MKLLRDMSVPELHAACSCDEGDEYQCAACNILGALYAGIPRAVIFGEAKLTDYFSPEYIESQCDPNGTKERK